MRALLGAVLLPAGAGAAEYRSQRHAFALVAVSEPLDQAWGLAFLPDGRMLVTEKAGNLRIVRRDGKVLAPLGGLPRIEAYGQGAASGGDRRWVPKRAAALRPQCPVPRDG